MIISRKFCSKYLSIHLMFTLFFVLLLSGCAGTVVNMRVVPHDKIINVPTKGKSMIVFMRPSTFGFAIQSSVFVIKGDTPSLVGIIAAKKKVTYQINPGKYIFMVIGESADFMSAQLEANRIYYALVTPRMGFWKARFSLKPVHKAEIGSSDFNEWVNSCQLVEKIPASDKWATENMPSIKSKYKEYYKDWMSKDSSDRPKLMPQDGKLSFAP